MIASLTVDLGAITRNVARLAELAAPAPPAPVIKANAYGHGLVEVGRALSAQVPLLCVYRIEEAAELRAAGVATPLLLLGPVAPKDLPLAHACEVALALWDTGSYAADVARVARMHGHPFVVHAKIDTGATRFGLSADTAATALSQFLETGGIALRGVYTHLAAAEELESEYTLMQLDTFAKALAPLKSRIEDEGVVRHAAASAAAMLYPQSRLDVFRPGIAIYGIWPSPLTRAALREPLELEPALSWRTTLVATHDVPEGTSVGYGCTFRTERASRIGALPIGYAEGVPRAVSNNGAVLVHGVRAPIVGRVCMNVTLVDLTDVPRAQPGDSVTLIGRDGADTITADDWGAWSGSIGYEVVARLPAAVPRTFLPATEAAEPTLTEVG